MRCMASLRDLLKSDDASLADRIERLASAINSATPDARKQYRREVVSWLHQPPLEPLATGLVGRLGYEECAQLLHERVQAPGIQPHQKNRYAIALGQLAFAPAADQLECMLRKQKTRAAATVALLLIDPKRAAEQFKSYAVENPEEGSRLAGVGLVEHYRKHRLAGMEERLRVIPSDLLVRVPRYSSLPEDFQRYLDDYTRRT